MLTENIASAVHSWAMIVVERINNQWQNLSAVHGEKHIEANVPAVFPTYLLQRIEAYGGAVYIIEYGSGSASDTTGNPYIDDYINDANFNDYRSKSDMTVRGRDAGEYTDLDGNEQYSTGVNAGKDLEAKPVYRGMAMVPMHVIREEITAALPELYSMINQVITKELMNGLGIHVTMRV